MEQLRDRITGSHPRSEIQNVIDEWIIGRDGMRNRRVVETYLFDGLSVDEMIDTFHLSPQGLKKIIYPNLHTIARHLEEGKETPPNQYTFGI
jgi:hypothetical protein